MPRTIVRLLSPLRSKAASRAQREREVLIRESALVLEGVRPIRLGQSDRLPFSR